MQWRDFWPTAGTGTSDDATRGGGCPADRLPQPAAPNRRQMKIWLNGVPEVPNNLPSIPTTIHLLLRVIPIRPPHPQSSSLQHRCTHTNTHMQLPYLPRIYSRIGRGIWATNPSISPSLKLAIPPSQAERGVGMLSRPRQSEIQSYVTNRCQLLLQWGKGGGEGKWKLTYQKGHSSDTRPTPPSHFLHLPSLRWISPYFFHPFIDQWYLTNNTNVIPLPSALRLYPSWFNGPVNCKYSLFTVS